MMVGTMVRTMRSMEDVRTRAEGSASDEAHEARRGSAADEEPDS
jgi:hypothetical protein